MKRSRKMDQKQAHLFLGPTLSPVNSLELAEDRKAELEETLAALLLQSTHKRDEKLAGGDDDHDDE
jgi:hypothetical protein